MFLCNPQWLFFSKWVTNSYCQVQRKSHYDFSWICIKSKKRRTGLSYSIFPSVDLVFLSTFKSSFASLSKKIFRFVRFRRVLVMRASKHFCFCFYYEWKLFPHHVDYLIVSYIGHPSSFICLFLMQIKPNLYLRSNSMLLLDFSERSFC